MHREADQRVTEMEIYNQSLREEVDRRRNQTQQTLDDSVVINRLREKRKRLENRLKNEKGLNPDGTRIQCITLI